MLVKGVISIGTKIRITIPIQRLCASIKTYSTSSGSSSDSSSGSSSDSSSDSDSDVEHAQKVKTHEQLKTSGDKSTKMSSLDNLIDKMTQENNNTNTVDIAIPLRKTTTEKKIRTKPNLSYKEQLTEAVENVTNVLGGNKKEIKLQLLDRLSHMDRGSTERGKQYNLGNLNKLVTNMRVEEQFGSTRNKRNTYTESQTSKTGIIHELKAQQENKQRKYAASNIQKMKENTRKQYQYEAQQNFRHKPQSSLFQTEGYTIFTNMKEPATDIPELSMWKLLEERELAVLANLPPQNVFQEMIQWTESGKLWTFPIDNEYGMEKEQNVHFSEHVFLERHLKDWCPKRGPVRHYMELVCIGLSKNPYMTVEEKINHITWYKDYFKGKEEILKELGAIDVSSSMEEQIKT